MSANGKIPAKDAHTLLAAFCDRVGIALQGYGAKPGTPPVFITGSLRREEPEVGDIDLVAPLPAEGEPDHLFRLIDHHTNTPEAAKVSEVESNMFTGQVGGRVVLSKAPISLADAVSGFKEGFRAMRACLRVLPLAGPDAIGKNKLPLSFPMEITRYIPGEQGNAGWAGLRTTGPAEYSEAILTYWKHLCGTVGTATPGSVEGFLVRAEEIPEDEEGPKRWITHRVPTPNETSLFELLKIPYTPPTQRTAAAARAILMRIPRR